MGQSAPSDGERKRAVRSSGKAHMRSNAERGRKSLRLEGFFRLLRRTKTRTEKKEGNTDAQSFRNLTIKQELHILGNWINSDGKRTDRPVYQQKTD